MLRFLALSAGFLALAACASSPQTRSADARTAPPGGSLQCTTSQTGNRLPARAGECTAGDVKSYTGEQLESTGATQVGDALRYLDPEVTITHH